MKCARKQIKESAMLSGVSASVATEYITDVIKARLVPMLHGSPGVGKSAIAASIAKEWGLELIDLRLSQVEPTDLNGFAVPNGTTATYLPLDIFPLENAKPPTGKKGWLLFLDEINSASLSVQKAAYKLLLDRKIGEYALHNNVAVMGAGNLESDNAIVSSLPTPIQSRLVHIVLNKDGHTDWLNWAYSAGIDQRITSYINFRPDMINNFDPDHSDYTFACQRTWEFAHKLIKNWDTIPKTKSALLAGVLGEGVAREFVSFTDIYKSLPSIKDIDASPKTAKLPDDLATQWALTGLLANNANENNSTNLITYLDRLPKEFQVVGLKEMVKRFPLVQTNILFSKKIQEIADML